MQTLLLKYAQSQLERSQTTVVMLSMHCASDDRITFEKIRQIYYKRIIQQQQRKEAEVQ